ncbi:MAG: TerC family protein [Rhodospirillales bacterium]|nr:TerC family protein [Rhodospirillales bacterium]
MPDLPFLSELIALASVVMIDIALAGDNAIVVGMAAAGLPALQRRKAILWGIIAAALLRIVFAIFTSQLLMIVGLMVAGGILLLWVSWKLWREIRSSAREEAEAEAALEDANIATKPGKSFKEAVTQIVVADVSMSLDNVLAVAGAAREHTGVLILGLALSVALMGLAASFVARLLQRYHWIAYVGLIVILFVAVKMIWDGSQEVLALL